MSTDQAIKLIRGPKGTKVTISVVRKDIKDPIDITMTRDTINIPTVDTAVKPGNIFVISVYTFSANSADLFRDALRKFVESGSHKLVLDLRGDPGGYLEAAVDMASWFLPLGKPVVSENYGANSAEKPDVYTSHGYNIFGKDLKMVILVDGGSASASEILTGALQDYGIATVVGEQSFGKGSVQELVPLTGETSLKVTIAHWFTPKGRSISKVGITPDVIVPITPADIAKKNDAQMNKALEILGQSQ
jgi:carboxyl-terminal processing protease